MVAYFKVLEVFSNYEDAVAFRNEMYPHYEIMSPPTQETEGVREWYVGYSCW